VLRAWLAAGRASATQFRLALAVASALWIAAGFLLPRFTLIDGAVAGWTAGTMAALNLVALAVLPRTPTVDGQHAIGTAVNIGAGVAVLWLVSAAGATGYAALMLMSVFAFVVLRLRFVAALAAAVV
jgi:hypothetical protein